MMAPVTRKAEALNDIITFQKSIALDFLAALKHQEKVYLVRVENLHKQNVMIIMKGRNFKEV
jgi:hypothetical protein